MSPAKKQTFLSVYNDLVASFLRSVLTPGDLGEEGIHLLRLDVKSLRNALDISGFIVRSPSGTKGLRAMMSPVFNKAGEIRSVQMDLALLRKCGRPGTGAYERALLAEETWSRTVLGNLMANFDGERFRRLAADAGSVIAGIESARAAVYGEKFLRARYGTIFRILKNVRTARDLHEIRKNVKSARNTIALVSLLGVRGHSGIERRIVKTIDQTLGSWHDEIVFRNHIRKFVLSHGTSPAAPELRMLAAGLWKKHEAGFQGIVRDTRRRMTALRAASGFS